MKENLDNIIILGCGLSGMLLALSFAKLGIKTTIIEAKATNDKNFTTGDIRTTAITASSRNFLVDIGLWSDIERVSGGIKDIYVVDNKAPEMIHFSSESVNDEAVVGYIVKNSEFKEILLKSVREDNLVTLIDECSYQKLDSLDNECTLYLDNGSKLNCDLLIVCDGAGSKVRRHYFSSNIEKYYRQTALTFIVTHEKAHEGTAVEHFMPSGPFAILPLKDQYASSIVWTVKEDEAAMLQNLPKAEFEYLVQRNFGQFLGSINLDSVVQAFPLKAYLTKKYFFKRITLIADSAHIIHPLAGQGLNQGIKDIQALTGLISKFGISRQALEKYQNLRQDDNMAMYLITDSLNHIFSNNSRALALIRKTGFKLIERLTPIKKQLIKYAMGER